MNLNLLYPENDEEEQVIRKLVDEIYQIESKIEFINNDLKKSTNDIHKNIELKDLNITKEILNLKLTNLNVSLVNSKSTYNDLIQQKDILISQLDIKLKNLKEELNNKDILKFKSALMIKYILSNNSNNIFLTEEQINNIIKDNQKIIKNNNESKKYILSNEIKIINEILSEISNKEDDIKLKKEEIKELLLMLKEEKNTTNKELINLISYKETLDTIIKINIHNINNIIKNNKFETVSNNNSVNNLDNENSNRRNIWSEPIKLYSYELSILDPATLAKSLSDNIFSTLSINNYNVVLNNDNNNENYKFRDSTTFNKNIINNTSFEDNNFSLNISSILPKEKNNNKNIMKNLLKSEFESFLNKDNKDESINILLKNIILILISNIEYLSSNNISENNLKIYLSYFIKSFYYQNIIDSKMKFINKEYKHIKKENKQIITKLEINLDKLNNNKSNLNNRINHIKEKIKILENKTEIKDISKISLEEEKYINICKEGNKLIINKNKINEIIELYKDKIKIQENIINSEINKIKNEIDNVDKKINDINAQIQNEKLKANEKIIENRKIISEKYGKIKNIFASFKSKHGNNLSIYNKLLNSINETLINKNRNSYIIKNINNKKDNIEHNEQKNNKCEEIVNFELDISKIEKKSFSKDKDSDLSLKKLNLLKFPNKSYNIKTNIIKNYQYNDSNSNSFNYKPNNKKDYNSIYNSNNGFKKNLIVKSKELSNNNNSNNINLFLKKKSNKIKNLNIKEKNKVNLLSKRGAKRIQNNNIIYNNNIYLTNNIISKIIKQNSNHKKIPKAKSLTNFYKKNQATNFGRNDSPSSSFFYTKINYSLTNKTSCYYREMGNENKLFKFNPFQNISPKIICEPPLNFTPCKICFNGTFSILKISVQNLTGRELIFSINEIKNTIVHSLIKLVVEIYRKFKKIKGNENDKKEIIDYLLDKFVSEEKSNYPKLSKEEIKKCALNKYYAFSILLSNDKKIEFIFTSYEDFKEWINGLALIIKNKSKIISTIESNAQ